jgi:hypothetical protein
MIRLNLIRDGYLTHLEYTQALLCETVKWVLGDVGGSSHWQNGAPIKAPSYGINTQRTASHDAKQAGRRPGLPGSYDSLSFRVHGMSGRTRHAPYFEGDYGGYDDD